MATLTMLSAKPDLSVRVWDPFVRIFHWVLVACVVLNYFFIDDGETVHQWAGYIACGLIVARVVWGFIGSKYARFENFFPTPARLRAHLTAVRDRKQEFHPGHNPLGAMMMLALMALVLALGLTGFLQGTDAFWGDEWLQDLHAFIASALISLVGVHVLAAIVMGHIERVNLIGAMITGVKRIRKQEPGSR